MQTSLQRMNPAALPNTSNLGYSQISIANAGILAFVSGQVAQAADGSAVPEGLEAQTKQVIANLTEALKALEASPQNIVASNHRVSQRGRAQSYRNRCRRAGGARFES